MNNLNSKEQAAKTVEEATERLNKLVRGPIKRIALELENSPAYLHSRAVSPGLQEFIEARTYCHWMQYQTLVSCSEVQKEFEHVIKEKCDENESERTVVTLLPLEDYMLGLADLTGELMRKAINSVSSGDTEDCFHSCQVVRDLYAGFLGVFGGGRELARKLNTSRANALKAEGAAYALCVRGRHAPAPLLVPPPLVPDAEPSDDEGYY
ncbi:Translin-associated protein X [Eumeta japonica]|uniref:Translin-associated protein X n=1 Tax=Eumeta variegata TaxID=151549 RepID=A0A4C1VAC7_EUMVA|nr:Translin-associated protein X [Eumeta japonica]